MSIAVNHAVLAKGWERFTIMHKDRKVAAIREDGTCTIYAPSFMPYNLYLETANDLDTRLNNLNQHRSQAGRNGSRPRCHRHFLSRTEPDRCVLDQV